jgi:chemotaxis signal transduction protein
MATEKPGTDSQSASSTGVRASLRPTDASNLWLCTFWMNREHLALDVALVAELVTLEAGVSVPLASGAVKGLFNLRGVPVPIVDLNEVLKLGGAKPAAPKGPALVIRREDLVLAFPVDGMDSVTPLSRHSVTEPGVDDHPAVACLLTSPDKPGQVITVLDPAYLQNALATLRLKGRFEGARA